MLYSKPTHSSNAEQRNLLQLEHVKVSSMKLEFWLEGFRLQYQTLHQAAEGGAVTSESCGLQLEVGQVLCRTATRCCVARFFAGRSLA